VYVQRSYLQMRSGDSKQVSTGVQASVKRGLWEPAVLLANAGMPYLVSVIAHFAPLQQSQAVCVILEATVDTLRIGRHSLEYITWVSSPIAGW
jgi:hypothetical protein